MAAKDPQPQSVSAGHGSVTGSSAGLGDDETRRTFGNADKYAVGMCRNVSDMLRIIISKDLIQLKTGIRQGYMNAVKNRAYHINKAKGPEKTKDDLDNIERTIINFVEYLQQIFHSDKKKSFDAKSNEIKTVKGDLQGITALVNNSKARPKSRLIDPALKLIRPPVVLILTHQIALQLSHALMHQLLIYQVNPDISELIALANYLEVFNNIHGKPLKDDNDDEALVFLTRFEQTWERIKKQETHVEESTEDVTAYNNFKSFLLSCRKDIFDKEMMKQFVDYKTWMEEDKIVEEQRGHLKRYADILMEAGALPPRVTLQQTMQSVMERGEAIAPQILEEMYLRVALCMRINDAYKLVPNTIRCSVLYAKWAGKGKRIDCAQAAKYMTLHGYISGMKADTNKYQGASMMAIEQAFQDISNWVDRKVDVRGLSKHQSYALYVHKRLVDIQANLQQNHSQRCITDTLTKVDYLLQNLRLQKREDTDNALYWNPHANIKWSPFYDRVQDEFSACPIQKIHCDLQKANYLLALLTRLQVAVLDEVLVQLSSGLDYLYKNFWFSDDDVKNGIKEEMKNLLVVVNDRKHQLGFFCATIANGTYLDSFSYLFHNFFTPELAGLCSTDQMIGERTKRGEFWWEDMRK